METAHNVAAYQLIQKVNQYGEQVGVNIDDKQKAVPVVEMNQIEDFAGEFLTEIVEAANTDIHNALYQDLVHRYQQPHRSAELLDIAMKSYEFVKDHWAEIFFILSCLERTGKLDRLKRRPKMKIFLDVLFDKKVDDQKDIEKRNAP